MDLQALIEEYAAGGIGEQIYREILKTVSAVTLGHGYPLAYSPTGHWDEDAFTALAHDWTLEKLIRYGQLEHLLLANQTLSGFGKGLELSFRHFLIGHKQRTVLDNLFQRAAHVLESDPRFTKIVDTGRKATSLWGLSIWHDGEPFQGSDSELVAAGFRIPEHPVIRYRPDSRRLSPVISDHDLAELLADLLNELRRLLSLEQMVIVFRYRFDLLEVTEVSLEAPMGLSQGGDSLLLGEPMEAGAGPEEEILVAETARVVLRELSPRQRQVMRAYAQVNATLTSVAELVGCSKSTVDNELRRAMGVIRYNAGDLDEAEAVYERLIEMLGS